MKALWCEAPLTMRLADVPDPETREGEVLIDVLATGICAGDQHIYGGHSPYVRYPVIAGHEICGRVVRTGAGVERVAAGDTVVVEPVVGCGKCYPCRHGKPNCCAQVCLIGVHRPGGFAEFVSVPAANVHRVPAGLDPVTASFAEPLCIGLHACRRGGVAAGQVVVVLGAGPIGLAVAEVARIRGAKVVVADMHRSRLDFVRELGVETAMADASLSPSISEATGGDGADVVIEAAGAPAAMRAAMELVAPGGTVVILGLVERGVDVALPGLDFTRKEVNLHGSRNSVGCFPEALALLASGAMRYPRVATPLSLAQGPATFARLHDNPAALHKGVLVEETLLA